EPAPVARWAAHSLAARRPRPGDRRPARPRAASARRCETPGTCRTRRSAPRRRAGGTYRTPPRALARPPLVRVGGVPVGAPPGLAPLRDRSRDRPPPGAGSYRTRRSTVPRGRARRTRSEGPRSAQRASRSPGGGAERELRWSESPWREYEGGRRQRASPRQDPKPKTRGPTPKPEPQTRGSSPKPKPE